MSEFQELKEKANSLRASKQFADALSVYELLWGQHRDICDETDGWSYSVCLQKLGRHAEALALAEELLPLKPEYSNVRNVLCWSTYFLKIKVDKVTDEADFLAAATKIVENSRQQDKNYPYVYTVYKVLDYLDRKFPSDPERMMEWTAKLESEILDDVPQAFTLKDGKEKEFPSDKEKYYNYRTKALLDMGHFDECTALCDEGLEIIKVFHFDNDIWMRRRKAVCKAKQGDIPGAILMMKNVLRRKPDWTIRLELAKLELKIGDRRNAMVNCVEGALEHGDFEKKGNLFKFMADMLETDFRSDDAKKHIAYAYTMRKEAGLRVDDELLSLVEKYGIDVNTLYEGKRQAGAIRRIWEDIKYEDQEQYTGTIRSILPNGKAGFVEAEPRKSYFFTRKDFKGKDDQFIAGTAVTFYLVDGFDTKKGIATRNAVLLRIVR
jgi:tetratricopeptide (TPR) repeat protein